MRQKSKLVMWGKNGFLSKASLAVVLIALGKESVAFDVSTAETVTNGGTNNPLNASETLTITNGGSIIIGTGVVGDPTGVSAIIGNNDNVDPASNTLEGGNVITLESGSVVRTTRPDDGVSDGATGIKVYGTDSDNSVQGLAGGGGLTDGASNIVTLQAGSLLSTTGLDSTAIEAYNNNIIDVNGNIVTSGGDGHGIDTYDNNRITVSGGITTSGDYADGLRSEDYNIITVSGDIVTTGDDAEGLRSGNNNIITISGDIVTSGEEGDGFYGGENNNITISGDIVTSGYDSDGVELENFNTINITGNVSTSGDEAYGLYLNDNNSITISGDIVTSGDESHGVASEDLNIINITGNVSTSGEGAHGLYVDDNNDITISGDIATSGETSNGAKFDNYNIINITGNVSSTGDAESNGVYVDHDNVITISGLVETFGTDDCNAIELDDENQLTLSGISRASGDESSDALEMDDDNTVIVTGGLYATGSYGDGIQAMGDGSASHISGTVSATGSGAYAFNSGYDDSDTQSNVFHVLGGASITGGANNRDTDGGGVSYLTFGYATDGNNKADFSNVNSTFNGRIGSITNQTGAGGWDVVLAGGTTELYGTENEVRNIVIGGDALSGSISVPVAVTTPGGPGDVDAVIGAITPLNQVAGATAVMNLSHDLKVTGDMIVGNGSVVGLTLGDSDSSFIEIDGNLTIGSNAKIKAMGVVSGKLENIPVMKYGGILTVVGLNPGAADNMTAIDFDFASSYLDTSLLKFTMNHDSSKSTIYIDVEASPILPKAELSHQKGVAKALDQIMKQAPAGGSMSEMIVALQSLPTDQGVADALTELSPAQMTAAPVAVLAATQSLGDVISGHVSNVSAGVTANRTASTNVKSGNENVLMNVDAAPVRENEKWVPFFETFRSWGDQDDKDGISGYDFDTTGFVLGTDYLVDDRLLVGFSISKMDTTVDSNDNLASTDIDTWQGNVYGSYFTDNWHFDAHAGLGLAQIESDRRISFMGATAESDHDAPFYTIGIGAGYIFRPTEGMTLEPFCELDYMQMNEESYKEKGAGGANLEIDENDIESLRSTLGVKLAQRIEFEDGSAITPEFSYKWQHEFENDAIASSASFLNGGSSFTTNGMEPDADHHIFGAGIKAEVSDSVNIYANYEYDVSDTFSSNNALVGIEFKF